MTQEEIAEANRINQEQWSLDRLRTKQKAIDHMQMEISALRGALATIAEWHLPYPGFSWENGSNGERDHFRAVARAALARTDCHD